MQLIELHSSVPLQASSSNGAMAEKVGFHDMSFVLGAIFQCLAHTTLEST